MSAATDEKDTDTEKEKRLVARANPEVHRRIAEAAELQGATVSQFLLESALERADRVTEQATRLRVSREGFEGMMQALDQPPRALTRLRRAARRYRENVIEQDHPDPAEPQS